MQVEVTSPERMLYSGDAEMVVCRTSEGDIAFLPGHERFLGSLGVGVVRIIGEAGSEDVAAVHGGFVEVADDRVTVLSDIAEMASEIDVSRARAAKSRAEARLATETDPRAEAALARAETRLGAVGAS